MLLVDSHCHLDILMNFKKKYKNINKLINLFKKNKFLYLLTISTNIKNFFSIFSMFSYIDIIKLSCGIHPLYIETVTNSDYLDLEKFVSYKKVIAVGETGLDYKINIKKNIKKKQIDLFIYHLYLANKYRKPCIIHSRNSYNDTLNIIKKFNINLFGAVIHCYSYFKKKVLFKFLDCGVYISISGLITYKNNFLLQKIIKYIPLDKLLVETDSPYLTPYPYRGSINNPSKIIFTFKQISKLKKISFYKILKININNFLNLFNIF